MNLQTTAKYINTIANFCAPRDLTALTQQAVQTAIQAPQVDVMVLFGGSILAGGDVLAEAIKNKIAYAALQPVYGTRTANPAFASR